MTSFCSEPENSFRILPSTVLGALSTVNHSWHPSWNVFIVFGDGNYKDSSSSSSQKYIIRHIKTVLNSIFTSILPASLLSKHCLHHVGAPILLWLYQPPLTLPCRHASTLCNVFPSPPQNSKLHAVYLFLTCLLQHWLLPVMGLWCYVN